MTDVSVIIPPVNLLPNSFSCFDDLLTLSLNPAFNEQTHTIANKPQIDKKEERFLDYKEFPIANNKNDTKNDYNSIDFNKYNLIKSTIKTKGLEGLYTLEFSNIPQNPVIYSRNGKSHYGSKEKSKLLINFSIKDLQNITSQQNHHAPYFVWSFMNPSTTILPYYQPISEKDRTLIFESRYESGNLGLAVRLSKFEYMLIMQEDSLTQAYTQCNIK